MEELGEEWRVNIIKIWGIDKNILHWKRMIQDFKNRRDRSEKELMEMKNVPYIDVIAHWYIMKGRTI